MHPTTERVITPNGYTWSLNRVTLTLHHPKMDVFWRMPYGFKMPEIATLTLAEHVLLSPFGEKLQVLPAQKRGDAVAVAFSGGVDSAAALELLPSPVPIYMEVHEAKGLHKLENARIAVAEVGGIIVVSNQSLLPPHYGKSAGVYGFGGWTLPSILLADHLSIGTVADGNIIEFIFMRTDMGHGTRFAERDLSKLLAPFEKSGFSYCMPCAGLTEVSTSKIAASYDSPMGCMRGTGGRPCLKCVKCYRKEALVGRPITSNPDVEKLFSKEAIPVLGTLLWAAQNHGLNHPVLNANKHKDFSWVEGWYKGAEQVIPPHLRAQFHQKLAALNIKVLEDETALRSWSGNNDGLAEAQG